MCTKQMLEINGFPLHEKSFISMAKNAKELEFKGFGLDEKGLEVFSKLQTLKEGDSVFIRTYHGKELTYDGRATIVRLETKGPAKIAFIYKLSLLYRFRFNFKGKLVLE